MTFLVSSTAWEHRAKHCLSLADKRMFRQRSTHVFEKEDSEEFLRSLWMLCCTSFLLKLCGFPDKLSRVLVATSSYNCQGNEA